MGISESHRWVGEYGLYVLGKDHQSPTLIQRSPFTTTHHQRCQINSTLGVSSLKNTPESPRIALYDISTQILPWSIPPFTTHVAELVVLVGYENTL
jgi:hypothetical protein